MLLRLLLPLLAFTAGNETIRNFRQAKKIAIQIHEEHPYTIYCGCRYERNRIDLQSCGYRIHKNAKRAARLEWEHVVPAENFGRSFSEWRSPPASCVKKHKKGRKCAETNPEFARMEGDLYNLWPEIGELNRLRNNYSMEALGGAEKHPASESFGGCRAVVSARKFEPMDQAKGIVARTYMYMDISYPGRGVISGKNRKLFEAWDRQFPVSAWECRRGEMIRKAQGNENPLLAARCKR